MATPAAELRFAILASGRGSNADALMDGFESGLIPATLALVVANVAGAQVLEKAARRGYKAATVPHKGKSREAHEAEVLRLLADQGIDHLLLAGYMRILSPEFLKAFGGAVLNIHPALLPDFPGLHAARRQWEAQRKVVGATVHFVDAGVDTGPIILQGSIVATGDEDAERLEARIRTEVEHVIYPRAVRLFLDRGGRPAPTEGR
ncbi:MAG: phosphoribosylglycinamide formyltransferase [Deltaproteobacteria bacterium]|nr:phosphoribosylglycinamide formyltransferase [Deltaproteobacteria bacterium]